MIKLFMKEACDPLGSYHPGNAKSLALPDIRDRLINFYKEHYSSNLMTLAVVGK
jgi:secreted Zn-dependent insulinase-like peptidase